MYAAPVAVVHYIAAHWYCPPQIFIDAVLACPQMASMEYKKALLDSGGRVTERDGQSEISATVFGVSTVSAELVLREFRKGFA